jgi:MoxR-like ATPase
MTKQRPIFLWGPPGIGKSDIVHQIGDAMNAHVIDVRLSLWEPTDIKGIPYFDSNANKMVWAPPMELPDEALASEHEAIILF